LDWSGKSTSLPPVSALLSGSNLRPVTIGFLVVGAFLLLSYGHKVFGGVETRVGVTSEMSGLATFLVGALVCYGDLWVATAISVASLLLLDLKEALEKLAVRIPPLEILTFAKFLLLTAVILPVVPDKEFTRFHINPFKTWVVVVAVSAISYGSYVLQKALKQRSGAVLAATLGGAYSSTVTTLVMARQASRQQHPHLFSGSILIASGVMYLRLVVLLVLFNVGLLRLLIGPFLVLAALAIGAGWLWTRRGDPTAVASIEGLEPKNPLELVAAFVFAGLFAAMLIATQLAVTHLGSAGVNGLAAVMGVTDVDPFILGLTQTAGNLTPLKLGAEAISIAAASNNLIKGIYAYSLADRKTGLQSLAFLSALAGLGLASLLWIGF
jgi:uncharacterized membrane protein (DUF4010 family)